MGTADDELERLLGVNELYMIRYHEQRGFFDALLAARMPALPDLHAMEAPRLLYLWKP